MTSCTPPENDVSSDNKNFTIASIFEKEKSLKFELLFGNFCKKICRDGSSDVINAVDYYFGSGEIFGFSCQSYGAEFRNFHHVFVLRACAIGESGHIIAGITPGARILVRTLTDAASLRLKTILQKLRKNDVELSNLSDWHYRRLNSLLETKSGTDFFVSEIINNAEWSSQMESI
jgi:hypothetical protein